MCNNEQGRDVPFLEQVELFAETMKERFISKGGKSLVVLAMDAQNETGKVKYYNATCGSDFDLEYCVAASLRRKLFRELYYNAIQMNRRLANG